MIDEEVEIALREIRERVVSQPLAAKPAGVTQPANGDGASTVVVNHARTSEAITRLNAHLTTTARAWDRLPPVFSNRTGTAAHIELWIKARLRTLTRWFTWEQVNFNAAAHHALGEALQALTDQSSAQAALEATCRQLQSRLEQSETDNAALRAELDIHRDDIHSLRAQLQADIAAGRLEQQNQQREVNSIRAEARGELETLAIRVSDLANDLSRQSESAARTTQLANELTGKVDALENEQRVCFKQLSLELNEKAVSMERARESTSSMLKELKETVRRLDQPKTRPSKL